MQLEPRSMGRTPTRTQDTSTKKKKKKKEQRSGRVKGFLFFKARMHSSVPGLI